MVVGAVEANSPAAEAGLDRRRRRHQPSSDIDVQRPLDFQRAMLDRKPGEQVRLTVRRGGESVALKLTLGDAPEKRRKRRPSPLGTCSAWS